VEDNWKRIKGRVRECWGAFRNKELDKIAGKRNQLEGKMQGRYGTAKKGAAEENQICLDKGAVWAYRIGVPQINRL
jgi:uncharacterized protein YjbJ (UPF0337 family)